ncbi:hypothetical protein H2O64_08955 [Kordia sp. YSTF-M3]|uniref:Isoleucyl-tRNA synthetase n=1 Tax=Kordia aestuariivivens TaxID=2759037 RepID=A0ABR7Q899_9FLAO|nr:hypothetical protein [Kordia aestuariivivens]MBC8754797.1 hypothetical protein [Kordia aestuariivivens]
MKFNYKTTLYFFLVFFGAGLLLFRDDIQGEKQIVLTIIALVAMMFGLYKMTSIQTSNRVKKYDNEEYFNRERYDEDEEEENVEETKSNES